MKKLTIRGGIPLYGDVYIGGMKNSALPILFATILTRGKNILYQIPKVSDIDLSLEILSFLGAVIEPLDDGGLLIDTSPIEFRDLPFEVSGKIRGSMYLIGAMLGRFGEASVGMPGGCNFGGNRPIDLHIKGFEALGARVNFTEDSMLHTEALDGLVGNSIYLDTTSVGATINIMLAATGAMGTTVIENAAREPHIADVANFLNAAGADISGAGTTTVKIRGGRPLHACRYTILPDMIEAGTYMLAAATAGGCVTVHNIIPKHMETVTAKLLETGVKVSVTDNSITVESDGRYRGTNFKALPYPGFPTDMHPQFGAMMCYAEGISTLVEGVFPKRFRYTDELTKMGADIHRTEENTALIYGTPRLRGASVHATDLRAGAALVIAALAADGVTEITGVEYIERGYTDIARHLRELGAAIELTET
ncbi:MAG: UDP-N-acetylglucosamine 1-carboxyvinyltransferase [Ruminococcaceae bacterium]|nr:UDP-N-acetylglucosamine 1-carboxyvinyltransferase [Oscillospiraceae bacterium]